MGLEGWRAGGRASAWYDQSTAYEKGKLIDRKRKEYERRKGE
jgi:hypothetical protein